MSSAITLPLFSITTDPSIQQRVGMDSALVSEYAEGVGDWIAQAPVVVFAAEGACWLADGFHRLAACRAAGLDSIPAIVHPGGRAEALRYALGANARHGKRRNPGDLAKAYRRAVAEQLVEPGDVEAVASLLNCSRRTASDLTREVREQLKTERDAAIQRLAEGGVPQREIAEQLNVPKSTVADVARKRNTSEIGQHHTPAPAAPDPEPIIIEEMPGDDLDGIRTASAKLHAET